MNKNDLDEIKRQYKILSKISQYNKYVFLEDTLNKMSN